MASSPCLSDSTLELSPAWSRFGVSPASPANLGDVATPPRGTKSSNEAMMMTPPRPAKKTVAKSPNMKNKSPSKSTSLSPKKKASPVKVAPAITLNPSSASSPVKRIPMKAMKMGKPGKFQPTVKKAMKVAGVKKTVMKRVSQKKGEVKGMKKPASQKDSMKKPGANPKAESMFFDDCDSLSEMHKNHDDDGTNWVSLKNQVELDNLLHETHAEWIPYFDFSASFKVEGKYIGAETFKQFMIGTLETDGWQRIKSGKKFEHWEKIADKPRNMKNDKGKTVKKNK